MAAFDGMPPLIDAPPTTAAGMFAAQAAGAGSTPWPSAQELMNSGVPTSYAPSRRSAPPYVPPEGWPTFSPPPPLALAQSPPPPHHHHHHSHSYPSSPQAQAWPEAAWPVANSPYPNPAPAPMPAYPPYPAYADGGTYEPRTSESAFENAMRLYPPESSPMPLTASRSYSYSTSSSGGYDAGGGGGGGVPNELETRRSYDRPGSWRPDFRMPRTGIESLLPIVKRTNSARMHIDLSPYELNPKLRFNLLRDPPVQYDLRDHLARIQFRDLRRPVTGYDLAAFVTEPPVPHLRILHRRLPWYIDVAASNQVGTTLQELFDTLHSFLHTPIYRGDLYNSAVDDEQRGKVIRAYRERCQGDAGELAVGIKRVDFLMRDCVFLGLVKGRDGTWEMRTRKA